MNLRNQEPLRVLALGQFSAALPPLAPRLAALKVAPARCAGIDQLPAAFSGREILLTDMNWMSALTPEKRTTLATRAAGAAGWITLTDGSAHFKAQVDWQRSGVSHFFSKPLDPERLAAFIEDIHDHLNGPPVRAILLDDDESSLAYYGEVLRHAGIHVLATQDPLLVLDALESHQPDLLLVDIEMPGCRGPELVTIVRQRPEYVRLPVIFLTAMEGMQDKLLARAVAAEDFLIKPVAPPLLLAAVEAHAFRYRAFQRDAASSRQQQASTRRHLEQMRQAIDEHAIVSFTDVRGNITYANEKFCAISGYRREELLGQNHRIVKSDRHTPEVFREMWRTIANGHIWQGEVCNRRKDGSRYWVSATIVPFLGDKGKPVEYISIRTDITALKNSQEELHCAVEIAERANRAKSDFLSSMSHELRTPMNAIIGFAQMLEYDAGLNADQQDSVHEILKAGRHLLDLINEVLDLARIESGHIELSLEPVDVAILAEECRHLIQPLAAARGIDLGLELPADTLVRADRVRLKQVLLNLLSNAVKYNRDGGRIRLGAAPAAAGRLRITVADTGIGIAPARLDEVFQPFNRLDAEFGEQEGTGIGLTITRHLLDLMGGDIGVDSKPGIGSTFHFELPADIAPAHDGAGAADAAERGKVTGDHEYRILCIDDNPANLKLMAQIFGTRRHLRLMTAHAPEIGIELALAHRPDLILLDINMPGMNGYQVLDVFKTDARLRNTPVIAVTANAMPRDIERGRAAGFADYLTKPLIVDHFLRTVDALLTPNGKT